MTFKRRITAAASMVILLSTLPACGLTASGPGCVNSGGGAAGTSQTLRTAQEALPDEFGFTIGVRATIMVPATKTSPMSTHMARVGGRGHTSHKGPGETDYLAFAATARTAEAEPTPAIEVVSDTAGVWRRTPPGTDYYSRVSEKRFTLFNLEALPCGTDKGQEEHNGKRLHHITVNSLPDDLLAGLGAGAAPIGGQPSQTTDIWLDSAGQLVELEYLAHTADGSSFDLDIAEAKAGNTNGCGGPCPALHPTPPPTPAPPAFPKPAVCDSTEYGDHENYVIYQRDYVSDCGVEYAAAAYRTLSETTNIVSIAVAAGGAVAAFVAPEQLPASFVVEIAASILSFLSALQGGTADAVTAKDEPCHHGVFVDTIIAFIPVAVDPADCPGR